MDRDPAQVQPFCPPRVMPRLIRLFVP